MKINEMSAEQIRHLALRCTDIGAIKLAKPHGTVMADSGDYFAVPARTEATKRYWRAAKADLRDRENGVKPNTNQYHGQFGRVQIGGRMFTFYPASGMLVRDDFAIWAEANWSKYTRMDGSERESTKPVHQDDVEIDPQLHMWKEIRKRVGELKDVHRFYPDQAWHTEYDMRHDLFVLVQAMKDCGRHGETYPVLKCDCDLLAAKIAYRQRKFADCKDRLLDLAAAAMRAALLVQEKHGAKEGGEA